MFPDFDYDDVRDFILAFLVWALGGWVLWEVRGWVLDVPGNVGAMLLGAINIIGLFYIFTLIPIKGMVSNYMAGGGDRRQN